MPLPTFSIILPVFNRATFLKRACDSIFKQTLYDFELIIVNDGSTDDTEKMVLEIERAHLDKIRTIHLIQNSGVSFARNRGIEAAQGEWIAFLDSDDEWLPRKLEEQLNYSRQFPSIRLIHGDEIWIHNGCRKNQKKRHLKTGGDIFFRSLELCLISPSTVVFKKELWNEIGGFDETFPVCEDYDYWLKVSAKYPVGFIDKPLIVKYGGHGDQLSKRYKAMDYWRVLALYRLLSSNNLNSEQSKNVIDMIKLKSSILINGYIKHNNLSHLTHIQNILNSIERYKKSDAKD